MIEIPEAQTLQKQLADAVVGKKISRVQAAQSPHGFASYFVDPANYEALVVGKTIESVAAYGGRVELTAGDVRISFHDGVNLRYLEPGAPAPKKHQLLLQFEDGSALVCTVQMYGGMMAFPEGALNDNFYFAVSKEKPSPLSEEFTKAYFVSIIEAADPKISAKALLATEQRIPGLGNGCLHDILYHAGVNPQSKIGKLEPEALDALYDSVRKTLAAMTARGGRDTEKTLYGKPGGYMTLFSSKTAAYGCPGCGCGITRKAYMGGNVYFCERCQPVLKQPQRCAEPDCAGGYLTLFSSKTAAYGCPGCGCGITRKAYMGGNVYFCERCQPVLK